MRVNSAQLLLSRPVFLISAILYKWMRLIRWDCKQFVSNPLGQLSILNPVCVSWLKMSKWYKTFYLFIYLFILKKGTPEPAKYLSTTCSKYLTFLSTVLDKNNRFGLWLKVFDCMWNRDEEPVKISRHFDLTCRKSTGETSSVSNVVVPLRVPVIDAREQMCTMGPGSSSSKWNAVIF